MISQSVEYALRAIVTLAQYEGAACTSRQISEITQVPAPFLSKLMQGLVRANLVTSKRGVHGGFLLTRNPSELTVWEVIESVEPLKRIRECPLGIASHDGKLCPLHGRLDRAMALVEESFRSATIAELLSQPGTGTPLCQEELMAIDLADTETTTEKSHRKKKA